MDDEVRALTKALGEGYALPKLTARGLVAACTACGAIMGVRDRHCPSCGAAAGAPAEVDGEDEQTGETPPLQEPSYDQEIEVRVGEHASVAAATETAPAESSSNGDGPAPWVSREPAEQPAAASDAAEAYAKPDAGEPADSPESDGEQEPVQPWPRQPPPEPEGAAPPEPSAGPEEHAERDQREPLVPRAQRTLRAGRRLARTWIEERRSGGR